MIESCCVLKKNIYFSPILLIFSQTHLVTLVLGWHGKTGYSQSVGLNRTMKLFSLLNHLFNREEYNASEKENDSAESFFVVGKINLRRNSFLFKIYFSILRTYVYVYTYIAIRLYICEIPPPPPLTTSIEQNCRYARNDEKPCKILSSDESHTGAKKFAYCRTAAIYS